MKHPGTERGCSLTPSRLCHPSPGPDRRGASLHSEAATPHNRVTNQRQAPPLSKHSSIPTGIIASLTTWMSIGDLRWLQRTMKEANEDLGPEMARKAYNVVREIHPGAPSLKELMAWDR